jgi:DNA-binding winged helix-turn-helix (wHTH) protein
LRKLSSKFGSKILKEILKVIMGNEINNLYRFAEFRFDGKKGKLWKNDELILLSPKAADLLTLLLEKNGEYVSKEEIFEKVWAGTFVEDGVLTQNIYTLRKALGNDKDGKPFIENI